MLWLSGTVSPFRAEQGTSLETPSRARLVAQTVKHLPTMRETWVQFLGREDLLEKEMATHSSILAWKIPPLLIATGEAIPLRGLEGVPGLPGAPQDEAGLTRKFALASPRDEA